MRNAKLAKTSGNYDQLSKQVKQDLAKCIVEGGIFIINVDDSEVKYESLYDPDLKEFYVNGQRITPGKGTFKTNLILYTLQHNPLYAINVSIKFGVFVAFY